MENLAELAYLARWERIRKAIGSTRIKHGEGTGMCLEEFYQNKGIKALDKWGRCRHLPSNNDNPHLTHKFKRKWHSTPRRAGKARYYAEIYKIINNIETSDNPIQWARRRLVQLYGTKVLNPSSKITVESPSQEINYILDSINLLKTG